MNKYLNFLTQ